MKLIHPFTTSFGTMRNKEFLLLEVIDSDGESGWGESVAFPEPSYNEETLKTNWHILESFLIPILRQQSRLKPNEISTLFKRIRGNNMAKSAVESAYWDLYAKKQGIPLAELVGGTKREVEVGISLGIQKSPAELLDMIEINNAKGYKRIKIKIKPGWDVDIVAQVRRRFPDIALMVDANSAYERKDIMHLKQLDDYSLMMIEQPFAYNDIIDHSLLQRQLKTPICLDESIHSSEDARKAFQLGSGRIVNLKVGRVGGIHEAIKLHDLCRSSGIPVWCGGMLESGIGRAHNIAIASLPGFTLPGDTAASANYWEQDLIEPEVTVKDGTIAVPDKPGIGYAPVALRIRELCLHEQIYRF